MTRAQTTAYFDDDALDLSSADAAPARVIEIGEITAGIAVPERGGVRFFSSERRFDGLDGTLFRTVEQAARAAREKGRQPRLRAV
ncbi:MULTISPECIES: hypothetical protein [Methylorubrum]|uniref:Uncharacterized protein n=3 Tax=Methylorubrum TaxID=2282523 RepID=A0A177J2V3_9HYPH|nr:MULTISPECIES: hypothetical protein [Methylorubrum]ACB81642.1 conserved hypothetical protein [Methylorubrum populi BJ001]KAB7785285.1 hypothetical protein F8B43_3318 [Methylorubrum populi]MBA8913121.1 hypothetical protein [Methylorubrum thiocyanatum]OAH34851.1 hypothetical protein AX289_04145 [Methylorubrum populi]PZP72629.1 MAG: hypothetical protein DI590_03585 [Methylorubrum populi]